jgi:genome maintenance exonuclease 1
MFQHNLYPRTEITDTTIEGVGRTYHTPDGDFQSVTTIISRKSDSSWLDDWRNRVGNEVADQISQQARVRGTAIHSLAEKYMMNDPLWKKGAMPGNIATFNKIRKVLDESIDVVYGIEYPLWSKMLNTAGRSDLPARFRDRDTIVDFKTSKKLKTRDDIHGYFIQSTCYAIMFEERTGLRIPQIAVIIAVDEDESQVFVENASAWYPEVARIFIK